jgi:molybdopterin molybdotransferase
VFDAKQAHVLHDQDISVSAAQAAILAALRAAPALARVTQTVKLQEALGRILAADLLCPIDVPAHDNAAMDGYAFAGAALSGNTTLALKVVGTVLAGQTCTTAAKEGECLRIMTGAVMPAGLDTVVPHEQCQRSDEHITLTTTDLRPGAHRRLRGEDLRAGQPALHAGRRLRPADLGLVASLGLNEVSVMQPLRVALFSTGDELCEPGQTLKVGGIFDSNRFSLMGALQSLGIQVMDLGLVGDNPQALRNTLQHAVAHADVVLTSGGVSEGDADHVRPLLNSLGQMHFHQVAMRPGRPFAFGALRGATPQSPPVWLFALPGNPVAALVTFYVLVRDALLQLAGATPEVMPLLQARTTSPIRKRPGRSEYQRGVLAPSPSGAWQVRLTGAQGAGLLHSMSQANAMIVLGPERGDLAAGEWVDVWLLQALA